MSVPTIRVIIDRSELPRGFRVYSVDVTLEVDRIPLAQLEILDWIAAERKFELSSDPLFEPGKVVEISVGHSDEQPMPVFKGPIVRHATEVADAGTIMALEAKDSAIKLTRPRRSTVYRGQSDGEVISRLVRQAGLKLGRLPATEPKHDQLVQYDASDWDFILSRADVLGLVVVADAGVISLEPMVVDYSKAANPSPDHSFEWNVSEIYNFELMLDAGRQPEGVTSVGWDLKEQKATEAYRAKAVPLRQGKLDAASVAAKIGPDTCRLAVAAPIAAKELQAWADARLARYRMSMIRGRFAIRGTTKIKPMDLVRLSGFGDRFNGLAVVTGIRHRVGYGAGWQTDVQFGLSPDWYCRRDDLAGPPAAGLIPPTQGLQLGVIDKFEEDPEKEYRARVILPTAADAPLAVWARLAAPDAGKGRGFFFRPETGDEVVVGFFNNDPRQPVILGALFGSKNAPPEAVQQLTEKNTHKAIVSRKGTTITFVDDDKPSVLVQTPGKNRITIDDNSEAVKIEDQHGNSITMNKEGIAVKSARDVNIEASGNVKIQGKQVDVK